MSCLHRVNGAYLQALAIALCLAAAPCQSSEGAPSSGPGEEERCPVCRMYVRLAPEWLAAAVLEDGTVFWFDGPKDLFRFVQKRATYAPGSLSTPLRELYVTEYYSLEMLPAREVLYVEGSDVFGPMGHELVPVRGGEEAREFAGDHKARTILTFDEIDAGVIAGLK